MAAHVDVATTLAGLARLDEMAGDGRSALERYRRVCSIYDAHPGLQPGEAEAQVELARLSAPAE